MCHDPSELPDGTVVACRKCELCRYNRVKDWAGRNIAQSKVSAASFACTLTYGPELDQYPDGHAGKYGNPIPGRSDHLRASVLTYSDVQNFINYVRTILKYPCDYFVTGELGGERQRCHWHIIIHFRGRVPTHELGVNFSDRHVNQFGRLFKHEICKAWPHGFMFWQKATFEDVFYNCKYILKDEDDETSQRKPQMSKKPPLGTEYFLRWADTHVAQHLAPQSLEYRFPEIKKKDGSPLIFFLKGRTAELFLDRFIERWKHVHGEKRRPRSDLVDLYEEYGKIVTDEERMLLRRDFPKGESRETFPSAEWIKATAEVVRAEKELVMRTVDQWQDRWIGDAEDGEERQARQEIVRFERAEYAERRRHDNADVSEFHAWKKRFGWSFTASQGWVHSSGRSDAPGGATLAEWRLQKERRQPSGVVVDERGGQEPLGKIGTWNKHYPKADA